MIATNKKGGACAFRALRDRWVFGKPIYVWVWVPKTPGPVSLGFTEDRQGRPLFESDPGWKPFGEPHTFPFGFATDPDYTRHTNTWCRVIVAKMLTEVRRNGFHIAPPVSLVLQRFSTVQEFPKQDGSGFYHVPRWGYVWADQDPQVLPKRIDGRPILEPWLADKAFDMRRSLDREACRFWHIQYDLSVFRYHVEPYAPKRIQTKEEKAKEEEEKARAEADRLAALRQEQLRLFEEQRQRIASNEVRRTQWPYKSWWWPKNAFQKIAFLPAVLLAPLLLGSIAVIITRNVQAGEVVLWATFAVFAGISLSTFASNPFDEIVALQPPAPPPDPTFRQRLHARLRATIADIEHNLPIPPPEVMDIILSVGNAIYAAPRIPPAPLDEPRPVEEGEAQRAWDDMQVRWEKADDLLFEAIAQSMTAYIARLPEFHSAPFALPFSEMAVSGALINDITRPFTRNAELKELDLARIVTDRFFANVGEYSDSIKNRTRDLYPQDYQGKSEEIVGTYLRGTPIKTLFDVSVPFDPFDDEQRFTHHWCMGDNGSGKTTFLRHLIRHDMERVAKGGCSLVVIDSKKLIREMRPLREFAPGKKLDGRLILMDADRVFPLNPFRILKPDGTPDIKRGTAMLTYMLAGLTDASKLQVGVLRHYIRAAYAQDNPTLYTIRDLMQLPKDGQPPNAEGMDEDTRKWFKHTRKGVASLTSGGAEQRLVDFLSEFKDTPIVAMLNADSFALDMKELDKAGTVLLVDTNRGEYGDDGACLLGRLIIALVDQLAIRRTDHPGPPLFCLIDEAQDYIAQDAIFAKILEKARSSKIGMTIAHHHTKQSGGFLPGVVAALEQTGIHSRCERKGEVKITKLSTGPMTLPVKRLEFEDAEFVMGRQEYDDMREWLAKKYAYKPSAPPKKPGGDKADRFDRP